MDLEDPLSQENRVNVMYTLTSGRILAGTDRGAFLFDGGRFEQFRPEIISASSAVDLLFRDRSGTIWIGTSEGLLMLRDSAGLPCRRFDLPGSPHVNAIAGDTAGMMWFATDGGIRCLVHGGRSGEPPRAVQLPSPLRPLSLIRTRALLVDRQGTLWVGTDEDGLFRYSAGLLTCYTTTNGLPASRISSLMEDRESNIWVATNAGLCRLGTRRIVNYTLTGKLAYSYVSAVAQDINGGFWFGTPYGLTRLRGERFTNYSVTDGLYSSYVLSLLVDRSGVVWIGTGRGLNRAWGGRITRDPWTPAGLRRSSVVRSLFQDPDGIVWAGWEKGFSAFRGRRIADFVLPDTLVNTLVVAICRGPGGSLWVGTQGEGLFRYSIGSDATGHVTARSSRRYGRKEGLTDVNIRALLADREGTLWVGTRYGGAERLFFSGDSVCRIARYGPAEGLSGDWVDVAGPSRESLVCDEQGSGPAPGDRRDANGPSRCNPRNGGGRSPGPL